MSRRVIVDEFEVEVPYGKLSAKTWHEETDDCKRVLALHGWMDNSGSFDNLMPLIKHKDGLYIVALDFPGHGRSSQLPPGAIYCDLTFVLEIRRCLTQLRWVEPTIETNSASPDLNKLRINNSAGQKKKFTIIGHSLGAGVGLFYASLFPDDVEEIILIDFVKPPTYSAQQLVETTARSIDRFLNIVPSVSPMSSPILSKSTLSSPRNKKVDTGQVVVSQETAIIATISAHKDLGALTRDDAKCLLKRSTVAVSTPPNGVIYSRDLRLQSMMNLRDNWDINKVIFERVRCHVFSLVAKQGLYCTNPNFKDHMEEMEEFLTARAESYYIQWATGDHYLHMNKPEQTAEFINRWLESPKDYKVVP